MLKITTIYNGKSYTDINQAFLDLTNEIEKQVFQKATIMAIQKLDKLLAPLKSEIDEEDGIISIIINQRPEGGWLLSFKAAGFSENLMSKINDITSNLHA